MVTSAQFQFLSDWPNVIGVNTHGEHLAGDFPSPLTVAPRVPTPDPPAGLQADNSPSQSWIGFEFKKTQIAINLGRIGFTAGLRSRDGPKGQSEAIVAPRDPGNSSGWDYYIWLLAGPGKLQEIVNSAIGANLDALVPYLKKVGFELDLKLFTLRVIDVVVDKLECTYAAVSKQGRKTPWTANLVLSFTGSIRGEAKGSFAIKFTNLLVHVGVTLDTGNPTKDLKVSLHRLQVAVDAINGAPLSGAASYYLPGVVNSTMNDKILNAINNLLSSINISLGSLEKYNLPDQRKSPASTGDFKEWMSKPGIQAKTLCQLKIPGTHDSAAYIFEMTLSEIVYDDQKFLWDLREGNAPADKDLLKAPYHIGPQAYAYVLDQIAMLGQAHHESRTIQRQLEDGVRFFDLRIYFDKRQNDYYTQHCLRGPKLSDVITQIQNFIDQHASSQELMIFQLSHSKFGNETSPDHVGNVANLIRDKLGSWVHLPQDSSPTARYDFQRLKDVRLSSITNGNPKVLFVNTDDYMYPHSILNLSEDTLYPSAPKGAKPGGGLYMQFFTTTPGKEECTGNVLLNCFSPTARVKFLQRASHKNNATVKDALAKSPESSLFIMDWYTESEGELPVDLIIKANG